MSWFASQELSALIGFALVLGLLYQMTDGWLRNVLMVGSVIFVAVPFAKRDDYGLRILALLLLALIILMAVSLYYCWDGGWIAWWVTAFLLGFATVSLWMWIQRDMPSKAWAIPTALLLASGWLYGVIAAPGAGLGEYADNAVPVEVTPTETLLRRDRSLLQSIYDATNGRPGIYASPWQVLDGIQLTEEQAEVAADRLLRNGSIEWSEENGLTLKRKGVDIIERHHRNRKKRGSVSNTFNFHGNTSGVFGSHNKVRGNIFHSNGVPVELVETALSAATELRTHVDPASAHEIELAENELREANGDETLLRSAARRMIRIAGTMGEVGFPLLRTANEIIKALSG